MADGDLTLEQRAMVIGAAPVAAGVFKAMGWTWAGGGRPFVPDQARIEEVLLHLLERVAAADEDVAVRVGRLVVTRSTEPPEVGYFVSLDLGHCWEDAASGEGSALANLLDEDE